MNNKHARVSPDKLVVNPNGIEGTSTEKLKWSYSKRSTFEQCARAYYYTYFGAFNQDPRKEHIKLLHGLSNRYLNAGSIAHLVIGTFFKKARQGEVWKTDRLLSWAQKMLRENRTHSRKYPDGSYTPPVKYPPKLLMEYYYGFEDTKSLFDEAESRLQKALTNFASASCFVPFRLQGQQKGAAVEEYFNLNLLPYPITGKVDLAYREDDIVTIVDWKTGQDDSDGDDSLQLAAYALWATSYFGCSSEKVRVFKAFLGSAEVVPFTIDQSKLEVAQVRIIQDAERMFAMEAYGHQGISSAFTPCYQTAVCRNCPFQELCYGKN